MKRLLLILNVFCALPCLAALNVPLTVQEALYPGSVSGVARTNEPFCMGVPIADSAAITGTGVLTLTGATAGQFRILGKWPSGNAKWIKVCGIVPSLSAGGAASVILTDGGSGNFGGSDLATDNGATITVNTGAATFTIKKANFNVIDSVVIGGTTVVASSSAQTRGLVLSGPDPTASLPGKVTCSPDTNGTACTTVYSSSNDTTSSCGIEESGPVMTVVRCTGTHKDASGNPYMQFTSREYFYNSKTNVKVTATLRNANYDTSASPSPDCHYNSNSTQCNGGSFNTAAKGIRSYELRIAPNITGTLNYTIATDTTPQTGTLTAADSAYIYQGASNWLVPTAAPDTQYCAPGTSYCAGKYTTDAGYIAKKNSGTIASGNATKVIAGWADIANTSGVGVEIGIDQMAAMWPGSLEFQGGGSDTRIGLLSGQNSQSVYMPWPMWKVFDTYLTFHASALASPANEFLKQQHFLVARPTIAYTNSTNVFPYPILDGATEDAYYVSTQASATPALPLGSFCYNGATTNCTPDRGTVNDQNQLGSGIDLGIYRYYAWSQGGSLNQEEFRWGDLLKFIQRGYTGRFLNSRYFYRFLSEFHWPHADGTTSSDSTVNGFTWRSRGLPELDSVIGSPLPLISNNRGLNTSLAFGFAVDGSPFWRDYLHDHWYGMTDYYFLTGDESVKEAIIPNKDWYLNTTTASYGTTPTITTGVTRAYGVWLLGTSRYSEYSAAIGDSAGALALQASAQHQFDAYINAQSCESGIRPGDTTPTYYPRGCLPGPVATGYVGGSGSGAPGKWIAGTSYERGNHQANSANNYCAWNTGSDSGMLGYYRIEQAFQQSILVEGLLSLRRAMGPTWNNYNRAADLAFGISQNNMLELFTDDGQAHWGDGTAFFNGLSYYRPIDFPVVCPAGTTNADKQLAGPVNGAFYDTTGLPNGSQGIYFTFYALNQMTGALTPGSNLERQFKIAFQRGSTAKSAWLGDWGMYSISNLIWAVNNPPSSKLQDVPFTVQDLGSGNYKLTFTTPAGTCTADPGCVRVKWSPKLIRPWTELLGFDSLNTNRFSYDPDIYATWFASNNVWPEPIATPGAPQTFTVSTGQTGLTAANFSVKANAPVVSSATGPAANLVLVSGNGQTGTPGQPLANPFVVKVTDMNGSPVSGTTVTFTVTAGGGTLNPLTTTTNGQGLASTTLTLGANAGVNTVTASSGSLTGGPLAFTATANAVGAVAANLVLVSGNSQTGSAGQALSSPFVVKVTDASGNPVSGTSVAFAVTAGGGTLNPVSATTTAQGLASTTLTLGPSPGNNTVTASSGTLAGSPLTLTATGTIASSGPGTVTWTRQSKPAGLPGFLGWLVLPYDPVSNQTMLWANDGGIYSGHMRFYNSATNAFTAMPGSGSNQDSCPADLPNMPGDRHPDGQMAVDTKRNVLWVFAGVNQTCGLGYADVNGTSVTLHTTQYSNWTFPSGGQIIGQTMSFSGAGSAKVVSVQDPLHLTLASSPGTLTNTLFYITTGTEASPRQDMYYLSLTSTPSQDVWHQVTPQHLPTPSQAYASAMIYDPDDDVLFAYGIIGNWIFCRTAENPTPGTPTAKQLAAGCALPDDWNRITPLTQGGQPYFPQMVYDTLTHNVIQYGGVCDSSNGIGCNQTWAYNIPTRTWTRKALNATPPPVYLASQNNIGGTDEGSSTYNPVTHKLLYHQITNTGAPADWQYDPSTDTWAVLNSINAGPSAGQSFLGYDVSANALIAWSYNPSGTADVWIGTLGAGAPGGSVGPATTLTLVSGNGQSGTVGQPLSSPFVVRVADASGNPVSGASVTFTVSTGGGTLTAASVLTNSQGLASSTLTLGAAAGANTVTASSGTLSGSPIIFSATGTASASSATYDLNGDGVTNILDVQVGITQALGLVLCTNGDVNHDGVCNVIDVQLIIQAAISSTSATSVATFVKSDTTTAGSWKGVYGADGYNVIDDKTSYPSYVVVNPSGIGSYTWAVSTNDLRALQKASSPTDRIAADWESNTSFTIDLAFSDQNAHQVALYCVDFDNYHGRTQRIDILDGSNNVLDTRTLSSFTGGQYVVWNVRGHVIIRITNTNANSNAVISGIFFR